MRSGGAGKGFGPKYTTSVLDKSRASDQKDPPFVRLPGSYLSAGAEKGGGVAGGAVGGAGIKQSLLTVQVLNVMIYGAKVGPVEVSHWISRGICLAVLAGSL